MSDIFQKVTSDEIDPEDGVEQNRRDEEIKLDKPPHHEDQSAAGAGVGAGAGVLAGTLAELFDTESVL